MSFPIRYYDMRGENPLSCFVLHPTWCRHDRVRISIQGFGELLHMPLLTMRLMALDSDLLVNRRLGSTQQEDKYMAPHAIYRIDCQHAVFVQGSRRLFIFITFTIADSKEIRA